MVLVAIVIPTTYLFPTGIYIFVALFVRLSFQSKPNIHLFNISIFTNIAQLRSLHNLVLKRFQENFSQFQFSIPSFYVFDFHPQEFLKLSLLVL